MTPLTCPNCEDYAEWIKTVTSEGYAFDLYACQECGETFLKPHGWDYEL